MRSQRICPYFPKIPHQFFSPQFLITRDVTYSTHYICDDWGPSANHWRIAGVSRESNSDLLEHAGRRGGPWCQAEWEIQEGGPVIQTGPDRTRQERRQYHQCKHLPYPGCPLPQNQLLDCQIHLPKLKGQGYRQTQTQTLRGDWFGAYQWAPEARPSPIHVINIEF